MTTKQKIKSITTILAALLCAAILAVVGTLFIKNNNSAQVAEAAQTATVNASFITVTEEKVGMIPGKQGGNISPKYGELVNIRATTDSYYNQFYSQLNNNKQTLVFTMTQRNWDSKAMWVSFSVNIKVPKYTSYDINYTFNIRGYKSSASGIATCPFRMEFYDFSNNYVDETGINAGSIRANTQFAWDISAGCAQTDYGVWANGTNSVKEDGVELTGTHTQSFSCDNTANSNDKNYSFNFGAYTSLGSNFAGNECLFYYEIGLDEDITISQTDAPTMGDTTSYDYDGTPHDFTFTYDKEHIAVSSLKRTDLKGTVTNLSPTLSNDSANNHRLTLTEVGKYEISFDLTKDWVYDNPGHDQKTKTFTFYIFPKKVNKPTDPNADDGLTYNDGNPQTFTLEFSGIVNSSNWSNYIAVDTLPKGVTNKGGGSFDIVDAGSYDLKLKLKDDTTTVWGDTTWDETTWDSKNRGGLVTLPLKVNPKPITAPTGINPTSAEYDGKAKTTNLVGWSSALKDAVNVTVTGTGATVDTSQDSARKITATNKGNYTIKASLKTRTDGGCNYIWSNTKDTQDKTFTFKITTGGLAVPELSGSKTATYNDGNDLEFAVNNYVKGKMDVVRNNANIISEPDAAVMEWDDGLKFDGTKFIAKNAGTYNIEFALTDHTNTQWNVDEGDATANQSISFTVNPKEVEVKLINSLNKWTWQKADAGTIDVEVSGISPNDEVTLTAYYLNSSNVKADTAKATSNGSGDTIVKATLVTEKLDIGTYTLNAELSGDSAANYTIKEGTLPKNISVGEEGIKLNDVKWMYTHDNVEETQADTTLEEYNYTFNDSASKLKYRQKNDGNPSVYEFYIDVNSLKGASLDTTKHDNGYKDAKVSLPGTHTVTVALKADEGFTFADGTTEKDVTLTLEVAKGEFDISNLKWQYSDGTETKEYVPGTTVLEYLPNGYKLTLELPAGLKVSSYSGNEQVAVNTEANPHYTAKVGGWICEDPNYNEPASAEMPECEWSIVPRTIKISWKEVEYKGANGRFDYKIINAPAYEKIVEYKYYSDSACTQEVQLENIEVDLSKKVDYYVVMSLKEAVKDNYVLSGDPKTSFIVGESKTGVELKLVAATGSYNGEAQGELEYDTISPTFADEDLIIKYYLKRDTEFAHEIEKPVNAGKYVMVAELSEAAQVGHVISGENVFDFEITKAALDMSGVKWGYIDEEGNEVEYDPAKKLGYAIENGQPKAQNVVLIGLPEYLKDKVTYGEPKSAMGKYTTEYHIDTAAIDTDNYELPDETLIPALDEWEITIREVEKPQLQKFWMRHDGTEKTFELNGYNENYMYIVDGSFTQTEVGKYSVKLGLMDEKNTRWAGTNNATVELKFEIIAQDAPEPLESDDPNKDPNDPNNNDDKPVTPGTTDDNNGGGGLPDNFPLWQVIVGGVSAVASVIFVANIASCAGKIKKVNKKADKLASKSFAAGAMVNGMLFGISNTWWTVIALSLAGVAVVLFIVLLVMKKALSNAEDALEEAQDSFNEAEKRRRDEDMKMLMMMMNGGGKGGVTYAAGTVPQIDMDDLAKRVAAALLPNMQQAAAQLTAGGEYDDAELRRRIEQLEGRDEGFDDLIEVDLDELNG